MEEAIPADRVRYHPASYVDEAGRLFLWEGGCYRGIAAARAAHVRRVIASPAIATLVHAGHLISSVVSARTLDGFAFLLEHPVIPIVSYAVEWTPDMLRDAALTTLSVAEAIVDEGLVLQDAHPWNVLFDGSRPMFVDVGSIVPAREDILWAPYEQFCRFFLAPLELAAAARWEVAWPLLRDERGGVSDVLLARLLPARAKLRHPLRSIGRAMNRRAVETIEALGVAESITGRLRRLGSMFDHRGTRWMCSGQARKRLLASLRRAVKEITFPSPRSSWSGYYNRDMVARSGELTAKEQMVRDLLARLRPARVVDVGANIGHFAFLAAELGADVVAIDRDAESVAACYRAARAMNARVLPLTMDVLNPTPASGWNGEQFSAATVRIQGDAVLALALIHHLAISGRQGIHRALAAIEAFVVPGGTVVLEIVGERDPIVTALLRQQWGRNPEYAVVNIMDAIHARARSVEVLDRHAPERWMVCYAP